MKDDVLMLIPPWARAALDALLKARKAKPYRIGPGVRNTLRGTGRVPRLVVSNRSSPLVYPKLPTHRARMAARRIRQIQRLGSERA